MIRRACLAIMASPIAAGCSSEKKEEQPPRPANVHEMMTKEIDPTADAIWSIGNKALNDEALIDPAKLTADDWQKLEHEANEMATAARALSVLDPIIVMRPGAKIADEGTPAAQVAEHLKGDPDTFRALAESLSQHASELARSSQAKDAATAGRLINEMDAVCENCHPGILVSRTEKAD